MKNIIKIKKSGSSEVVTKEVVLIKEGFITPYFIEALGEEGLLDTDVAKSLGLRDANDVRKKFEKWEKGRNISARRVSGSHSGNRLAIEQIAMSTRTAKMFIATYRNAIGEAYLNHLLDCEEVLLEYMRDVTVSLEEKLKLAERYKVKTDTYRFIQVSQFLNETGIRPDIKVGTELYGKLVAAIWSNAEKNKEHDKLDNNTMSRGYTVKRFDREYLQGWTSFIKHFKKLDVVKSYHKKK